MKRPRRGSSWLRLTPGELLRKLATLIPPPRVHGVRYHGVFAPSLPQRVRVVPQAGADADARPAPPPSATSSARRATPVSPAPPLEGASALSKNYSPGDAIQPDQYLADLFRVLGQWPDDRYLELAPKYWARTRARLDPAELAAEIGPLTIPAPLAFPPAEQVSAH